jgi:two-component system, OmpR family, response regulator BaeR
MTVPAHVLVAEDDPKIAQLLVDYLHAEGHVAQAVADGHEALALLRAAPPALLLLDLMLPGLDGLVVCRELRRFSDVPVMMITARVDEIDRLLGLDNGADDYVCKPFSPREVMARVRALLRRAQRRPGHGSDAVAAPQGAQGEPWRIDETALRITWRGQLLPLTPVEFRLLRRLLGQPGRVFSRAQLLDQAHAELRDVSDRTIDSHIKNLRRKIEAAEPGFAGIASVYGVGYRFELAD